MENILKGLEPQSVLNYFEKISQIPRGSGNEKAISDYLCNFAKELNLEYIQDEHLNVIIKKPATEGYENCPGVIIQGHMDMVCEKNKDSNHDFLKDPIQLRVVDDMIYATGTTLGADNGIAVAYGMALLASNTIKHPELEILITTDEEVGMTGAKNLDTSVLTGKYMLNLDSEEEGKITVSCAGGVTAIAKIKKEHYKANHNCSAYMLGENFEIQRSSDDGEPSGTAGVPMLGVLENHNLTNVCVVVTRYFGGIKLGAGGLIRAYAGSVALAVKEIGIIEIKEQAGIAIQMSYAQYQEYGNFLREHHLMELDTNFTDQVDTMIYVDKEEKENIKSALVEFFNGKVTLTDQGLREVEVPVNLV